MNAGLVAFVVAFAGVFGALAALYVFAFLFGPIQVKTTTVETVHHRYGAGEAPPT